MQRESKLLKRSLLTMYSSRAIEGTTVSTGQVYNAGKRSVGKTTGTGTEYPKPTPTDNQRPTLVKVHIRKLRSSRYIHTS